MITLKAMPKEVGTWDSTGVSLLELEFFCGMPGIGIGVFSE